MSILVIQGPHGAASARVGHAFTRPLHAAAAAAGVPLAWRRVRTARSLTGCLQRLQRAQVQRAQVQVVLLDAGDLATDDHALRGTALRQAIEELPMPYIEVQDDAAHLLEPRLHPRHAPLVTVVLRHQLEHAYALALSIALRRLASPAPLHPTRVPA